MTTLTQQDRISYSFSFKLPSGESFHMSYSTDVRPDESPEKAMDRARAFVMTEADQEAPPAAAANERVNSETFDPGNQAHYRIACCVFDDLGITSDKARDYKLKYVLKGGRVGDIRRLLEEDERRFREQSPPRRSYRGRA